MAFFGKINEYSLRLTLGILAAGSLTQFILTFFDVSLMGYGIIVLQFTLFICFWMLNKNNGPSIIKLPSKYVLFMNYVLLLLYLVSAFSLLYLLKFSYTDLIGTSNLLLNIFSDYVHFGIVSPEFTNSAYHSVKVDYSTINTSDLFYPAGSLYSVYFLFSLINSIHVFSLINMQLLFMAFLVINLFFLVYFYLLLVHKNVSNFIYLIILSFNFFPLYYLMAGDIALLSSSVYVILILLLRSEQLQKPIYFVLNLIITFYLHPLGVIELLIGYAFLEVSSFKKIFTLIFPILSFVAIIVIALKDVFKENLENYFYASNDYFEVVTSINQSSEPSTLLVTPYENTEIVTSFLSYCSRLIYVISDLYYQNDIYYLNLIPLCIIFVGFILHYQKLKFYLILLIIVYTSVHSDMVPTELVTIFNSINFGDKYRLDSLRFLAWLSLLIFISKHPKATQIYKSPILLFLLASLIVVNFHRIVTIDSDKLLLGDSNYQCNSMTVSTLYNSTVLSAEGLYQKCYLLRK